MQIALVTKLISLVCGCQDSILVSQRINVVSSYINAKLYTRLEDYASA